MSESFERPVKLVLSRPVGYSLLACLYWSRSVTGTQRRLIALIFVLATAYGALYSGSGEELVLPVVIWFLVRWLVGGRSPVAGFALLVALFFAIQPVKLLYRGAIRYEEGPANYTERLQLVSNIASSYWSMVSNDSEVLTQEIRRSGSERLSLLLSTATVVEQTPTSLPYLQGSTLTYLAVGWVPRFLWADKPTAYVANSTLPVRYGLQTAAGAERAMFSVGQLGEIYANFGPLAILPAFVFIGLIYSVPVAFVRRAPPIVQTAILMAVIVEMGPIGTSLAINFGGAPQLLIVQMLVLRFATSRRPGSAFGQSLTTSPVVGN